MHGESERMDATLARKEAQRRMRIVDAAENGILSQDRCSVFDHDPPPQPPAQYAHWDFVVAHAVHFGKLLRDEKRAHRKDAKQIAKDAAEYWKNHIKRKTREELEQEEIDRQKLRYKQVVMDMKGAWSNVKVEIDKERIARWEEEQLQLGHQAMDDMFQQAQEILGRNHADTRSSVISDNEEFDESASDDDASDGTNDGERDDIMTSSGDESEDEDVQGDEDARLTSAQLRAKYEQLPDLSASESENEDRSEVDEENADQSDKEKEEDAQSDREASEPGIDLVDVENLPSDQPHTNGIHKDDHEAQPTDANIIDPANVELEQVDDALLDSDDDASSSSGSEAWSTDAETGSEDVEENGFSDDTGKANDSDEEDDVEDSEHDGMMGFLSSKEIKKLKDVARKRIEEGQSDEDGEKDPEDEEVDVTMNENDLVQSDHHGSDSMQARHEERHVNGDSVDQHSPEPLVNGRTESISTKEQETDPAEANMDEEDDDGSKRKSRNESTTSRAEVPSLLRGTLREYQHDGLDWLANMYESETNGILADEMGLGKTIQTISLLAYIAVNRGIWGPHLVVVPTSVMLNWEMEFRKFLPGFKILTYYGDISERKRKRMGWRNMGKDMYNVVITSYQLILQDAAAFKMRAWHYLVLDEAHNIKNFKSQRWQTMLNLRTERRLLLTGTPLQNNIDELWSLLYFLMPAGFAGEGRIASLEEFTLALKDPTKQILDQGRQKLDAEAQRVVSRLHEVLRPYLLRRLKSEVEKQMPGKYEHVVYCKLSKRQRQLYDGFMGRASTKEILSSGNYMSIINCLMSLRKVCNHPDLFETRAVVTSMAMPKSAPAQFEIKNLMIRKRLQEGMEEKQVNLDALNLILARREQYQLGHARRAYHIRATRPLEDLIERQTRRLNKQSETPSSPLQATMAAITRQEQTAVRDHLRHCLSITRSRTQAMPVYGKDIISAVTVDWHAYTFGATRTGFQVALPPRTRPYPHAFHPQYPQHQFSPRQPIYPFPQAHIQPLHQEQIEYKWIKRYRGDLGFRAPLSIATSREWNTEQVTHFFDMVPTIEQRAEALAPLITRFTCVTPAVVAEELTTMSLSTKGVQLVRSSDAAQTLDPFHESRIRQSIAFPDKRLLQYDCGKLQRLATLLRDLQAGGHRALIFTQMTKVLDILEQFLNIHGHRYLRLDGSTKVEQRQILTDRFNNDNRILCFILSSRSGGLGINLTGADSVIFYDLDWNPAMDKQCQDRAHRIGQTRDVHIYKFVSEYTIEANILRKSNQKRLLDDVIIQKGDFTTDAFNKVTWRDALDDNTGIDMGDEAGAAMDRVLGERAGLLGDARVMNTVEDTEDRNAASIAQKEIVDEIRDDKVDFNESSNAVTRAHSETVAVTEEEGHGEMKELRHVDEYMLERCREEFGSEPWRPANDKQKKTRKGQDPHVRQRKKKY